MKESVWGRGFFAFPTQGSLSFAWVLILIILIGVFFKKKKIAIDWRGASPALCFLAVLAVFSANVLQLTLVLVLAMSYLAFMSFEISHKDEIKKVFSLGLIFGLWVHIFFAIKQIFLPGAFHVFLEPLLSQDLTFLSRLKDWNVFRGYGLSAHPNHLAFFAFQAFVMSDFLEPVAKKIARVSSLVLLLLTMSQSFILISLLYSLKQHFHWRKLWTYLFILFLIILIRGNIFHSPSLIERLLNYQMSLDLLKDAPVLWGQSIAFMGSYAMKPWDYQPAHWNLLLLMIEFKFGAALLLLFMLMELKKMNHSYLFYALALFLFLPDPMLLSSFSVFALFFMNYFAFFKIPKVKKTLVEDVNIPVEKIGLS